MAYTKQTWVDEVLPSSATYTISGTGTGQTITLDQTPTVVGSDFSAARLNHIEEGIYSNSARVSINGARVKWVSASSYTVGFAEPFLTESGDVIDISSAITVSGLSLTADTFYHVYVYLSGGVATIETVTDAPAAWKGTAYSKTSDTSRRYLISILTDGSGDIMSFVHIDGMVYYNNAVGNSVLSGGTATAATGVDLSAFVPPTATLATIRVFSNADQRLLIGDDASVSTTSRSVQLSANDNQNTHSDIGFDSDRKIWYAYTAAVGSGGAYISVLGYKFER